MNKEQAAEKCAIDLGWVYPGTAENTDIKRAFIAGAEWAAGNGDHWVLASDRKPSNNNLVHINYSTTREMRFKTTGYYENDYWYRQDGSVIPFADKIKWLDESGQSQAEKRDVRYFIEDIRTQKWFYLSGKFGINHSSIYGDLTHESDRWTNDPNLAYDFRSLKAAQKHFDKFYTGIENYKITEHEFIGSQAESRLKGALEKICKRLQDLFLEKIDNPKNKNNRLQNAWNSVATTLYDCNKILSSFPSDNEGQKKHAIEFVNHLRAYERESGTNLGYDDRDTEELYSIFINL